MLITTRNQTEAEIFVVGLVVCLDYFKDTVFTALSVSCM